LCDSSLGDMKKLPFRARSPRQGTVRTLKFRCLCELGVAVGCWLWAEL
jgi:hypothetical protein